ncbi:MAG: tetratricopeptide repeat protein [Cyanobacteria bacterium SZAS-4]|nr:tetratricopeptide repeat protein [Cyanobacteria bacterium SZAS-4]
MAKFRLSLFLLAQCLVLNGALAKGGAPQLEQATKAYDQALYGTTLKLIGKSSEKDYAASLLEARTHEAYDGYASDKYAHTADLAPNPSLAAMWRGYGLFLSRKYLPAQNQLLTAIRLNPNNALAHAFLGCSLCYADELERGLAEIKKAQTLDPTPNAYDQYMAIGYVGAGESKKAEVFYDKVIAKNPNSARYYIMRADFLDEAGKFPAALADYNRAIKLSPQSQYAYFRRAHLYSGKKMYAESIPDAIKGSELENVEEFGKKSRRLLALAYEKTGQPKKTIEVLKPYVAHCEFTRRLSGTDKLAIFSLIEACEKVHDYKTAKVYVDWVCRIEPKSTEALAKRARVSFELNDCPASLRDYSALLNTDPTSSQWFIERAKVYEKLGKTEQAKADLAKSKSLED